MIRARVVRETVRVKGRAYVYGKVRVPGSLVGREVVVLTVEEYEELAGKRGVRFGSASCRAGEMYVDR